MLAKSPPTRARAKPLNNRTVAPPSGAALRIASQMFGAAAGQGDRILPRRLSAPPQRDATARASAQNCSSPISSAR